MKKQFIYIEANSYSPCEFDASLTGYQRNDYQEILWLKKGDGVVNIILDDQLQTIPFNAFVIIGKGRIHYMNLTGFIEGAIIRFADEFMPKVPHILFNEHSEKIWIDTDNETPFFEQITKIFKLEYENSNNGNSQCNFSKFIKRFF